MIELWYICKLLTSGMHIRPGLVNLRMDSEGGGVDGLISDYHNSILVYKDKVGDGDL